MDDEVREMAMAHAGVTGAEVMAGTVWAGELRLSDGRRFVAIYDTTAVIETRPNGVEICWRDGKRV